MDIGGSADSITLDRTAFKALASETRVEAATPRGAGISICPRKARELDPGCVAPLDALPTPLTPEVSA